MSPMQSGFIVLYPILKNKYTNILMMLSLCQHSPAFPFNII